MEMIVAEEVPYLKDVRLGAMCVVRLVISGTDVTQEARYGQADGTQTLPQRSGEGSVRPPPPFFGGNMLSALAGCH